MEQDFHHPFTPYDIQIQFMQSLYTSLDQGKVAIFESPTGKLKIPPNSPRCPPLLTLSTFRYRT